MRKLSHDEIVARQISFQPASRFPVSALLNNVRSLYNVGSIFRTADGARLSKLYLCGYTGFPPARKVLKTSLGATETVPWQRHACAVECARELKQQGVSIVLLEQTDRSEPFDQAAFSYPLCLVVGNEIEGIDPELVKLADQSIEIPMYGVKNSLNVAIAFGIAAFHLIGQYQKFVSPPLMGGVRGG